MKKTKGEKILGKVEHFFGHISVAAIKVKAPIKVGDLLHFKGHTTDFIQKVESLQINHQNITKAKKGDDLGIKVFGKVRVGDKIYLSAEKTVTPKLLIQPQPLQFNKPPVAPPPAKKTETKPADPYSKIKFIGF